MNALDTFAQRLAYTRAPFGECSCVPPIAEHVFGPFEDCPP